MVRRVLALALTFFAIGCQMAPTKVGEKHAREFEALVDKAQRPVEITDDTVVLDTRSHFDYGLNRVQNSLHFPWSSLAESEAGGEVMRDKRKAGLRLALHGLQPLKPVLVVGYGPRGDGAEGRLAWTLLYLGFQDVQVAGIDMLRKNWTTNPSPPAENVPVWPVHPREGLQIGEEEFTRLALDPKGRVEKNIHILDVRSQPEYFNKTKAPATAPDINAMNIEWREFYTSLGRPNPAIRRKLEAVGVKPDHRVILISNKGVRSGAAAYALIALGYTRVQNFTGGWQELLKED